MEEWTVDYDKLDRDYTTVTEPQRCFCGRNTKQCLCLFGTRQPVCADCWPFVRYNLSDDCAIPGIGVYFEDGDWHLDFPGSLDSYQALTLLPAYVEEAFARRRVARWTSVSP
jgi:hypothetical protein